MQNLADTLDVYDFIRKHFKETREYPSQRQIQDGLKYSALRANTAVQVLALAGVITRSSAQKRILSLEAPTLADCSAMVMRKTQELMRGRVPQKRAGRKTDNFGGL